MGGALTQVLEKKEMADIIDLKLVPFGNTHVDASNVYHCQHGVGECMSDVIMQCALYKLTDNIADIKSGVNSLVAWPFIHCLVVDNKGHPVSAENCFKETMAKSTSLLWTSVIDCYQHNTSLVQATAMAATPPHEYTAWIIVKGNHVADGNALMSVVCNAYTGNKPAVCATASPLLELFNKQKKSSGKRGPAASPFEWI